MNNGKVRIYELSKELNLDNRDILAVCDQLNIAVKSHSSTISEAEAEQIRSAAQKLVATRSSSANSPRTVAKKPAQAPVKKQQTILAVHRNSPTLVEPPRRPDASATPTASPPPNGSGQGKGSGTQSKAAVAPRSPMPLTPPTRPGQVGASSIPPLGETPLTAAQAPVIEQLAEEEGDQPLVELLVESQVESLTGTQPESQSEPLAETQTNSLIANSIAEELPVQEEMIKPVVAEAPVKPEVPELEAPPPRPAAASNASSLTKPTLKRSTEAASAPGAKDAIVGGSIQVKEGKAPKEGREGRPPREQRDPSREAREGNREGREARDSRPRSSGGPSLKPKPVIELRSKPVRPGESPGTESGDGKTEGKKGTAKVITVGVAATAPVEAIPELKRPTPPRPPKRGKDWEEEEEEVAQKKAGTKTKRRSPVDEEDIEDIDILEELDDLDEEENDEDESTVTQVSLSLLRPPKPKSSKPAAQTVKSSAPPRRKSGESRFRRDRRQEETRQRPELIQLSTGISLHDLAEKLVAPETELIRILFMKGIAANINQILDIPTAAMVAEELGVIVDTVAAQAEAKKVTEMIDATDLDHLQRRSPIVTVMGHVDHGKTTLLDSIRKTKVAAGEAGGITQHIGAYHVDVEHEGKMQQVVFLDTPGHEAFTAMRARGARVTDIAILVVAADDGVRPQTIEAISHAKAAGVPIVVAINKVDKEEAQPDRVKQELTEFGLVAEEWGGDTIMVPVSAIKGENLDTLLEMLLLVAEVEDLYANPDRAAKGTVVEANLDKSKGPVASLIVQNGTLHVGDILVAGSVFGKVRAMIDDRGHRIEEAGPSFAVQVLGLNGVPDAGDEFDVYKDEKEARNVAESRFDQQRQSRLQQAMASRRVSLGTLSAQAKEGELKELNLIVKADVQGSVEAILGSLQQLPQKEVQVRVLLSSPGEVTETDVDLAAASSAVIIGFNTTYASGARQAADREGVDVREYNIIYKLLEDIQGAMEGLLEPELVEEPLGQVEVRAVFPVGKGAVAGCYVKEGKVIRNSKIRVLRKGTIVFEGNLDSLKRMKEDTKEVNAGYECGIGVDNFKDWQEGDIISSFRLVTKRRTLSA